MKIMIINGPNLNMLGIRQKDVYGVKSYEELCIYIQQQAAQRNVMVSILQSNSEGQIIDFIQQAYFECYDGIVINPGAYTHYSYAIFDALQGTDIPAVEVHLSDIRQRESFRRISVTAPACIDQFCGVGFEGYVMAIDAILKNKENKKDMKGKS